MTLWLVSLLLVGCRGDESVNSSLRSSLDSAEQAEQRQQFVEAHQLYARAVQQSAQILPLPMIESPKSPNDVYLWFGSLLNAYTGQQTPDPSIVDSERAFRRLRELEKQLGRQEGQFAVNSTAPLSIEAFLDRLRQMLVPNQSQLPPGLLAASERAYREGRFSVLQLPGDGDAGVSGLLYSPEYRWALPLRPGRNSTSGAMGLLPPGTWLALSWLGPDRLGHDGQAYEREHDVQGEYSASFFTVPDQPHEITMRLSAGS